MVEMIGRKGVPLLWYSGWPKNLGDVLLYERNFLTFCQLSLVLTKLVIICLVLVSMIVVGLLGSC